MGAAFSETREKPLANLKETLAPIQDTIESLLSELRMLKTRFEQRQIPFAEQDYFNLALALERIQEAQERLAGILHRYKSPF